MASEYKFTIIIATYNAGKTIYRCLSSLKKQRQTAQIIVVDGLSQDSTAEIAQQFSNVEFHQEKDDGVYDAWNKGLKKAKGEWIIFLGADDFFDDVHALEKLNLAISKSSSNHKLAYGRVRLVGEDGSFVGTDNVEWHISKKILHKRMPITHVGMAHHSSLFQKRNFDSKFKIAGDYNFLFPILKESTPLFVKDYEVTMELGGLSTSPKSRARLLQETLEIRNNYKIDLPLSEKIYTRAKLIFYSMYLYFQNRKL